MPVFDMPLEQLKTYRGTNPKPADFDAVWSRWLKEMRSVDPQVELIPSSFQAPYAECFDMYFTGVAKARIYAKMLRPKVKTHGGAIVLFHGYAGNSGDWALKLHYVAAGFTVAALDCRGQGGKSEDSGGVRGTTLQGHFIRGLSGKPDDLLYRKIFLDTAQLTYLVMDMDWVDAAKVAAIGDSQGGGLTLACAGLVPELNMAIPIFPFLSDYRRVWDLDLAKDAYAELKDYFRRFDPRHEREEEIFTRLGYIDVQYLAAKIKAKVKMLCGLADTICPPSTQFAAYNKIQSEKSLVIYPDYGHETMPDRSDIIFQEVLKMI